MISIQTIADIDAYVFLLRTNKAIATRDQSVKNFVVQDFDIKDKKLKVSIVILLLQLMFITIPIDIISMLYLYRAEHSTLYHDAGNSLLVNLTGFIGVLATRKNLN